jgi:hypothetical protein
VRLILDTARARCFAGADGSMEDLEEAVESYGCYPCLSYMKGTGYRHKLIWASEHGEPKKLLQKLRLSKES